MSNINWEFILEKEGYRLQGYVPNAEGSNSGVTIASGFDLGQRSLEDLEGLPQKLINKLAPYLMLKGAKAEEVASFLEVSDEEAQLINKFAKSEALLNLKNSWESETGTSFDTLNEGQATALASVAFQYGDLKSRTPNFWKQTTSGDWDGAIANLRNFGDAYNTRRNSEADFLQSFIAKKNLDDLTEDEITEKVESFTTFDEGAFREVFEDEQTTRKILDTADTGAEWIGSLVSNLEAEAEAEKLKEFQTETEETKIAKEKAKAEVQQTIDDGYLDRLSEPGSWESTYNEPRSDLEQKLIDKESDILAEGLRNEYSLGDATKQAIVSNQIIPMIMNQMGRPDLAPDVNYVPKKEDFEIFMKDLPAEYLDNFESVHSYAHGLEIRRQILDYEKKKKIIMSQGQGKGIALTLASTILDPAAWVAIALAETGVGTAASVMSLTQKATRLKNAFKSGLAGGVSIGAIETYFATQNPEMDMDDVKYGILFGSLLGASFGALRRTGNLSKYEKSLLDTLKAEEAALLKKNGMVMTSKGDKYYKGLDNKKADWEDPTFDINKNTMVRSDGHKEILLRENAEGINDEVIVRTNKDGTIDVLKCK